MECVLPARKTLTRISRRSRFAPATVPITICSSDCSGNDFLGVLLRRDCVLFFAAHLIAVIHLCAIASNIVVTTFYDLVFNLAHLLAVASNAVIAAFSKLLQFGFAISITSNSLSPNLFFELINQYHLSKISAKHGVSYGSELSYRSPTFDMDLSDFMEDGKLMSYERARKYFAQDPSRKWVAYVAGAILVLMTEMGVHFNDSITMLISSAVPEGKGVSSSASVEVASISAIAAAHGNHEIEPQVNGITFKSYLTRFAVPAEESGSKSNLYYSFDAGGIHFIMLGAYADYNSTGAQFAWLKQDLQSLDRSVTPWLVASWHPPWYNSYASHYQEFECMRLEMEALLYQYGVDIVFNGHVHAYERMNRVYNYTSDKYGPVYIIVGDGGNIEKVDVDHDDDPGKCPSPGDNIPEIGLVCHLNFSSSPAKGNFCWSKQPEWSTFRESSFGHGILEARRKISVEDKQPSSFPSLSGPQAVQLLLLREKKFTIRRPSTSTRHCSIRLSPIAESYLFNNFTGELPETFSNLITLKEFLKHVSGFIERARS
ncbi:Purple acid phosphatase [Arachis hypogaea]|nr:Purple acid phosphatase [Arachis hypogaea]